MTRFIRTHRPLLGSLVIVLIGFLVALILTRLDARTPENVTLIPAVSTQRNSLSVYGVSPIVASALRRHPRYHCGLAVNRAHLVNGVGRQRFQHCRIEEHVRVYRLAKATPQPTHTPPRPTVRPSPINPAPAATPPPTSARPTLIPTRLPPLPIATATAVQPGGASNDSAAYELSLMNQSRASAGLPPYTLNPTESAGTATCPGSQGHADHMAQAGVISHDQFPGDICVAYSTAGENVGEASGSATQALDTIHGLMMAEPHMPPNCGNHACNILSTVFRQVGIGIVTTNNGTYLSVDFIG